MKQLLSTFILAMLLISCSSVDTVNESVEPEQDVFAAQILKDYRENEVAARHKYGNKVINVVGIVASIEQFGDKATVLLNDGNHENIGIKCTFNKDQFESLFTVKKGDMLSVVGIGEETKGYLDYYMHGCRVTALWASD